MFNYDINKINKTDLETIKALPSFFAWASKSTFTKDQYDRFKEAQRTLWEFSEQVEEYFQNEGSKFYASWFSDKYENMQHLQNALKDVIPKIQAIEKNHFKDSKIQKPLPLPSKGAAAPIGLKALIPHLFNNNIKQAIQESSEEVESELKEALEWSQKAASVSSKQQKNAVDLYYRTMAIQEEVDAFFSRNCLVRWLSGKNSEMKNLQQKLPALLKSVQEIAKTVCNKKVQFPSDEMVLNRKRKQFSKVRERFLERFSACVGSLGVKKAAEAHHYIEHTFAKLERGENIPLPRWFHATKENSFETIIRDKKLKQNLAMMGYGAYVSSKDEFWWYGSFTFALDDSSVAQSRARFYNSILEPDQAKWIRVENEIPIVNHTVAYVAAPTGQMVKIRKLVERLGFPVLVMDRDCSDWISKLVNNKEREVSANWRPMYKDNNDDLIFPLPKK